MIYNEGTVSITYNDYIVHGSNVNWDTLALPFAFIIDGSNPNDLLYEVSNIIDHNTLYLATPFKGSTKTNSAYKLCFDYTPKYNFPIPVINEENLEETLSELAILFENIMVEHDTDYSIKAIDNRRGPYKQGVAKGTTSSTTITGHNTHWDKLSGYDTIYFKSLAEALIYEVASIDSSSQLTLKTPYLNEFGLAINTYIDGSYYYLNNRVSYNSYNWQVKTEITDGSAPIKAYIPGNLYYFGDIVLDGSSNIKKCIVDDTSSSVYDSTKWATATAQEASDYSTIWKLYYGEAYELLYDVTPTFKLPLFTANMNTLHNWANFLLQKIDTVVHDSSS